MFFTATETWVLIIARALQGISGAVVWIVGLALLADTVDPSRIGVAMGYVTMAFSAGTMVGPFLGGVMYEKLGHWAVFAVALGLVVFDILLRLIMIEKRFTQTWSVLEQEAAYGTFTEDSTATPETSWSTTEVDSEVSDEGRKAPSISGMSKSSFLFLLRSPRILTCLWATTACAIIQTSLESVSNHFLYNPSVSSKKTQPRSSPSSPTESFPGRPPVQVCPASSSPSPAS